MKRIIVSAFVAVLLLANCIVFATEGAINNAAEGVRNAVSGAENSMENAARNISGASKNITNNIENAG